MVRAFPVGCGESAAITVAGEVEREHGEEMRKACEYCGQRPVERDEEIDLAWARLVKAERLGGAEYLREIDAAEQTLRDLGIDVDALLEER
jgi:hypothetical protein